ncbi:putative bifunctional diguanylate cyclase/phosphodiesterase [Paenibacillus xylaniclasticus]|uniref:putative bifunctional diguanylate cyclase/phosphodiesterase n=1 Tax=Paenibacillus xylaniclasticus TaxID=588083 RepID=UPI000FDAFA1B|nr:EAL domain-containing protein [Paenibacillus xylaniclasticus]
MKSIQSIAQHLIQKTPLIITVLAATSLSSNMLRSVHSTRGLVFALSFAMLAFVSIFIRSIPAKYVLATAAFIAFFCALPELTFDRLVSVLYLSLIYLAFLLPSPLPTIVAAGYYIYYTPSYSPEVQTELISTITIGAGVNCFLYCLLAFYFRGLRKENKVNEELNKQLQTALGKLEHMAYYDSLTQLPNRERLKQQLAHELANGTQLAVMFLDLDNFKNTNDMMGHNSGDLMLKDVATRLHSIVGDSCFISRYAGDEFILLYPYKRREDIEALAKRLIHSFQAPFQIHHNSIYSTLSIGISLYPEDARDVETLIQYSDEAMYDVKTSEKNGFRFFSASMSTELLYQIKLENDLRGALNNKEFTIHYQPLVELRSGKIRGVEALLRWRHPELGLISPGVFIPIAERTGVIVELGEWVLEEACRQVKSWQLAGSPELMLAVNVSIRQFKSPDLTDSVSRILSATDFDPALLELEVTESLMQNLTQSIAILHELKNLGVKISIDDFGTGYSSLSVLRHLPVDLLKIDRSFTQELTADASSASIVKLIIDIGHSMNLEVVCEGIEHEEEIAILQQYGCKLGQGHYYQRPAPPEEVWQLMCQSEPSISKERME